MSITLVFPPVVWVRSNRRFRAWMVPPLSLIAAGPALVQSVHARRESYLHVGARNQNSLILAAYVGFQLHPAGLKPAGSWRC